MEALKAEVERKRRERAAVEGGGEKRKTFASKKQRREEEEEEERRRRREEETKREEFKEEEEEETKREEERKRSNGTATGSERESEEEKRATRANKSASKFRSAAARRAFENDASKETNQNESASKTGSNAREELHKQIEREVKSLTNEEVIVRLRKLNQPAKLFAENEQDRRLRLEVAAKNIKVKESDEHVGGQQGNEMLKYNRESSKEDLTNNNANATTTTTNRKLTTKEQEQEKKKREEEMARLEFERAAKRLKKQIDAETDPNAHPIDRVAEHFKRLLKEWAMDIEGTKFETSAQKRQQVANCELTKTHMKPLFKKMKKRDLPNDIERALFLVFEAMKARDYKRATDAYVGVAIGNAAWPIGVTSVGIHDRSARERISATTQAHAMHDEETRKYLQSVKRLITFSQRAYPTNPSLAFDFNSGANGSDKKALENAERATPGFLQNTVSALPRGDDGAAAANVSGDGGRKWESLMRHAYDNVKVRSARGSEDGV